MPTNLVKTKKDEAIWAKAKAKAAKQGKADDWPYVNSIFQNMQGKEAASILAGICKKAGYGGSFSYYNSFSPGAKGNAANRYYGLWAQPNIMRRDFGIQSGVSGGSSARRDALFAAQARRAAGNADWRSGASPAHRDPEGRTTNPEKLIARMQDANNAPESLREALGNPNFNRAIKRRTDPSPEVRTRKMSSLQIMRTCGLAQFK